MSKLSTIVSAEYRLEVKSKSFWITTLLFPLLLVALGGFIGYLSAESDAMKTLQDNTPHPGDDISGMQMLGMMAGLMLFMFITMYGAMIFNKVKTEKTNRIVEILISCVPGRTVMFAKVIGVALIGLTQIAIWIAFLGIGVFLFAMMVPDAIPLATLFSGKVLGALILAFLFFAGGFCLYGGLYAMAGAITDRNNENQGYLSIIMMLLMVSFYIGIFAVDNSGALTKVCFFVPFTSPTVAAVQSIGGLAPWYMTLLSLVILYGSAAVTLIFAGKAYTSAVLLKGKKLSPRDLIVFFKAR